MDEDQLAAVRLRVKKHEGPWYTAFQRMLESDFASLTYAADPYSSVDCGPYSNPNHGCSAEREDAIAAYTHALAWVVTHDVRHARKSVEIMNAWSATLDEHTSSNAPLQAAWAGSVWPRAAEIIRYTYSGWSADQVERFESMLLNAYLPVVDSRSHANGNWELTMIEATMGISVFLDDRATYERARARLLDRVPAYIYLNSDGPLPKTAEGSALASSDQITDYWHRPSTLVAGISQETCRDLEHTGFGLSAISHAAETARIQGDDMYPKIGHRLRASFELNVSYELSGGVPTWLCAVENDRGLGPVSEIALSVLAGYLGCSMPHTERLVEANRPFGTDEHFIAWETLTHGLDVGNHSSPANATVEPSGIC